MKNSDDSRLGYSSNPKPHPLLKVYVGCVPFATALFLAALVNVPMKVTFLPPLGLVIEINQFNIEYLPNKQGNEQNLIALSTDLKKNTVAPK